MNNDEDLRKSRMADVCADRLAARVCRDVETLKMEMILEAMPKPFAASQLGCGDLGNYYRKVAILLDTDTSSSFDAIGSMYTICAFLRAMQDRSPVSFLHLWRVSEISVDLGRMMNLSDHDRILLEALGVMHDVGKLGIGDEILFKPEPLVKVEWEAIKRHPAIGYRLVRPVHGLSELADLILAHHERWDGEGYPLRLKGEEIPLIDRVLALSDSLDAMINDRPYRQALRPNQILGEISACCGAQFDPAVVEAFLDMIREGRFSQSLLSPLRDAM